MTRQVSVIIVNYNAPFEMLEKCLKAVEAQTYKDIEVILGDNGSAPESLKPVKEAFPGVKILEYGRNLGFADGNNRAIMASSGGYILLLNNDAYLKPDAVEQMVAGIEKGEDIVGVAPKMMLEADHNVFDSIGTLIDFYACAFNMGIGQVDIGQYDRPERVFGGCFGATLLRRDAFGEDKIGLLDTSYFMYYEDVDWCLRANLQGYRFVTAPTAVVYHEHSYSTKKFAYKKKYYLIERNLMRTVMKDFKTAKSIKVFGRRFLAHVRNIIRGPFRTTSLKLVVNFPLDFVRFFLIKRWPIQKRRIVSDEALVQLSDGEKPFFDPAAYAPIYNIACLLAIYRRLFCVTGEEKYLPMIGRLMELKRGKLRFDNELVKDRLLEVMSGEPGVIIDFIHNIKETHEP